MSHKHALKQPGFQLPTGAVFADRGKTSHYYSLLLNPNRGALLVVEKRERVAKRMKRLFRIMKKRARMLKVVDSNSFWAVVASDYNEKLSNESIHIKAEEAQMFAELFLGMRRTSEDEADIWTPLTAAVDEWLAVLEAEESQEEKEEQTDKMEADAEGGESPHHAAPVENLIARANLWPDNDEEDNDHSSEAKDNARDKDKNLVEISVPWPLCQFTDEEMRILRHIEVAKYAFGKQRLTHQQETDIPYPKCTDGAVEATRCLARIAGCFMTPNSPFLVYLLPIGFNSRDERKELLQACHTHASIQKYGLMTKLFETVMHAFRHRGKTSVLALLTPNMIGDADIVKRTAADGVDRAALFEQAEKFGVALLFQLMTPEKKAHDAHTRGLRVFLYVPYEFTHRPNGVATYWSPNFPSVDIWMKALRVQISMWSLACRFKYFVLWEGGAREPVEYPFVDPNDPVQQSAAWIDRMVRGSSQMSPILRLSPQAINGHPVDGKFNFRVVEEYNLNYDEAGPWADNEGNGGSNGGSNGGKGKGKAQP